MFLPKTFKALNGLFCADVPLRNYSLTHSLYVWNMTCYENTDRQTYTDGDHELGFSEFCFDWNIGELSRNYASAMNQ